MLDGSTFEPNLDAIFAGADDEGLQASAIHGNIPNSATGKVVLAASE
jgi:hypothetical protein